MRWFTAKDEDETYPLRDGEAEVLLEQAKRNTSAVTLKFSLTLKRGEEKIIGRSDFPTTMFSRMLSRRHLVVGVSEDGRPYIRDLQSRNGTFLRGERIASDVNHGIHPSMGITVGGSQAPFEIRMTPVTMAASADWTCELQAQCFETRSA